MLALHCRAAPDDVLQRDDARVVDDVLPRGSGAARERWNRERHPAVDAPRIARQYLLLKRRGDFPAVHSGRRACSCLSAYACSAIARFGTGFECECYRFAAFNAYQKFGLRGLRVFCRIKRGAAAPCQHHCEGKTSWVHCCFPLRLATDQTYFASRAGPLE